MSLCMALWVITTISGCENRPKKFNGNVNLNAENGTIKSIAVKFPSSESTVTLSNAEETDIMIAQLESMLITLKEGRRQMGGINPTPVPKKD